MQYAEFCLFGVFRVVVFFFLPPSPLPPSLCGQAPLSVQRVQDTAQGGNPQRDCSLEEPPASFLAKSLKKPKNASLQSRQNPLPVLPRQKNTRQNSSLGSGRRCCCSAHAEDHAPGARVPAGSGPTTHGHLQQEARLAALSGLLAPG